MEYEKFAEPVWIYVGLNVPSILSTVTQAFVFLDECPNALRGAGHRKAMEVCGSAMRREANAEAAREAVVNFANERGILAPDITLVAAARHAPTPAMAGRSL